ncbi:MAG: hypothetical protein EBQ75_07570 [Actinobacteria bacterium]|nr:hypothetical protein [Actinomycetota bacterium]
MPGGTGGELVALEEQHVRAAHLGQVIEGAHARDAATNDHDSCALGHDFPRCLSDAVVAGLEFLSV